MPSSNNPVRPYTWNDAASSLRRVLERYGVILDEEDKETFRALRRGVEKMIDTDPPFGDTVLYEEPVHQPPKSEWSDGDVVFVSVSMYGNYFLSRNDGQWYKNEDLSRAWGPDWAVNDLFYRINVSVVVIRKLSAGIGPSPHQEVGAPY